MICVTIGLTILVKTPQEVASGRILFTLDVSRSMLAREANGTTRLDNAKAFIQYIISKYPSHQYGLYIFAGEGMDVLPFTQDAKVFLTLLKSVDEKSVYQQGSDIFAALWESIERFHPQDLESDEFPDGGLIILLSDFEPTGTDGNYSSKQKDELLSQLKSLTPRLKEYSVAVSLLGFGSTESVPILSGETVFWDPIFQRDRFWNRVFTKFDQETFDHMQKLFSVTGMHVRSVKDAAAFQLPPIPTVVRSDPVDMADRSARIFGMLGFVCLLLWWGLFYYFDRQWK